MFIAALLIVAKTWRQPKCPSTDEWIKKNGNIYTMEYYSAMRRGKLMSFAPTGMDLEIVKHSEASQKEKDKYHILFICGI